LYGGGWFRWDRDPASGRLLVEEALEIARELNDDDLILNLIQLIGWRRRLSGDYLGALRIFQEGVDEYRRPGRKWPIPWGISWLLLELAETEFHMGEFESGAKHADEAVVIGRELDKADRVLPISLQGSFAAARGDHVTARARCEQSVTLARELGRAHLMGQSLLAFAAVACWQNAFADARASAEEVLSLPIPPGQKRDALERLGITSSGEGDLEQARSFFERVLDSIHSRPWWPHEEPMAQLWLGRVALLQGELETASALFGAVLSRVQEIDHKPFAALALEELGSLAAAKKEFERGATLYGSAEVVREETSAAVPMDQRRFHAEGLEAIKAGLDEESFERARSVGRSMSLDDAVLYALEGPNGN
ncbi:MAG: tetratricopeptide repeat protein, partial [Acidimicrobiia bacterium]